jgi:hypothetical protein
MWRKSGKWVIENGEIRPKSKKRRTGEMKNKS